MQIIYFSLIRIALDSKFSKHQIYGLLNFNFFLLFFKTFTTRRMFITYNKNSYV